MVESGSFWVNLDLFIDRQNEALDNWLGGKAISLNSPQEPEEPKKRDSKPILEVQESSDLGENPTIHSMKILTSAIMATRKKKPRRIVVRSESSLDKKSSNGKSKRKNNRNTYYKLQRLRKKKKSQEEEEIIVGPIVDCSFNLPRVSSQLERLMGTNVVRLTDRKYMQELRRRIKEDYNVVLQKRIAEREVKEIERTRNLLIEGHAGNNSTENPPMVLISKQTHSDMARRRAKLKTVRERNAERLVRQGIKWEKERLTNIELDRQRQIEAQKKREEELMIGYEERHAKVGGQSTRIQIQTGRGRLDDVEDDFSETDKYDHEGNLSSGINSDTDDMNSKEFDVYETNVPAIVETSYEKETSTKDEAIEHLQYEDPAITLLKATDNVDDLYVLADEIISGSYAKNNGHKNGEHISNGTGK